MRGLELLNKLEYIDPELIEEAGRKPKKRVWGMAAGSAAAVAAVVGTVALLAGRFELGGSSDIGAELDLIPGGVGGESSVSGSGSGTSSAGDSSEPDSSPEYVNGLPVLTIRPASDAETAGTITLGAGESLEDIVVSYLDDTDIDKLPVYSRGLLSYEAMRERLYACAELLGWDAGDIVITDNAVTDESAVNAQLEEWKSSGIQPDDRLYRETLGPSEIRGSSGGLTIIVRMDGAVYLPLSGMVETAGGCDAPNETVFADINAVISFLFGGESKIIGMAAPTAMVTRNSDGAAKYTCGIYDAGAEGAKKLLSFSGAGSSVVLCGGDALNDFTGAWIYDGGLDAAAEYPVISEEKAKESAYGVNIANAAASGGDAPHTANYPELGRLYYRVEYDYIVPYYRVYTLVLDGLWSKTYSIQDICAIPNEYIAN